MSIIFTWMLFSLCRLCVDFVLASMGNMLMMSYAMWSRCLLPSMLIVANCVLGAPAWCTVGGETWCKSHCASGQQVSWTKCLLSSREAEARMVHESCCHHGLPWHEVGFDMDVLLGDFISKSMLVAAGCPKWYINKFFHQDTKIPSAKNSLRVASASVSFFFPFSIPRLANALIRCWG